MNLSKIEIIKRMFGVSEVMLSEEQISIEGKIYPVVDGVIILLPPEKYTERLKIKLARKITSLPIENQPSFARDIQNTFGDEWTEFGKILPEHKKEFLEYFDLINCEDLKEKLVCDLGCGNGRWSYFLKNKCDGLVLIDFSDAVFTARQNVGESENIVYIMADLTELSFKKDAFDFLFSLGVLHHLPVNCLTQIRKLKILSPESLFYLYYALDNRPFYFYYLLKIVSGSRKILSQINNKTFRKLFVFFGAYFIYLPLVYLGKLLNIFKRGQSVPLYEFYKDKSIVRIKQDVYDRFFTRIEQRVSRKEILELADTYQKIIISENQPFWHFVCKN